MCKPEHIDKFIKELSLVDTILNHVGGNGYFPDVEMSEAEK